MKKVYNNQKATCTRLVPDGFSYFIAMRSLALLLIIFPFEGFSQLIINEVSQGASGSQEFVEFVVVGSGCNACVDIRGWIFDDNNGWHENPISTGQGIADGALRFAYTAQWACVPAGTIIVVYNDGEPNTALPADDVNDANNDCVYIIPGSSTLFDRSIGFPNSDAVFDDYSTLTWTNGGSWNYTSMANPQDSYQITDPNATGAPYFSIGWASNTLMQSIYFAGNATGDVMYFDNSTSDDPFDQNNWSIAPASTTQTPGAPNTAANATWISGLNNNCNPLPPPQLNLISTTNPACFGDCTGSATVLASGGTTPYTYLWDDTGAQSTATATGLCAGMYYPIVTDAAGCLDTLDTAGVGVLITEPTLLTSPTSGGVAPCACPCSGSAYVFPTGGTPSYTVTWDNGYNDQFQSGLCNGTYSVTVTDANGCTSTGTVTLP